MASKWPRGNNRTKGQIRRWKGTEGSQAHCVSGVKYQIWRWQLWEEVYWPPEQAFPLPLQHIYSTPFMKKNDCPAAKPVCNSYGSRLASEPHSFRELGARHLECPPWLPVPARVALLWWTVFLCTCLNWLRFHQIRFLAPGWISQSLPGKSFWGLFSKSQDLSMWQVQCVHTQKWEC